MDMTLDTIAVFATVFPPRSIVFMFSSFLVYICMESYSLPYKDFYFLLDSFPECVFERRFIATVTLFKEMQNFALSPYLTSVLWSFLLSIREASLLSLLFDFLLERFPQPLLPAFIPATVQPLLPDLLYLRVSSWGQSFPSHSLIFQFSTRRCSRSISLSVVAASLQPARAAPGGGGF